ncbi:hypothetical protein KCU99_g9886, partial [Aureobasidium melanogenum]
MVRAVTDDDIGVRVLHEPALAELSTNDEIIDILAVHGIGAHPDDTWCKNVGTKENPRWALIEAYHDAARWHGIFQSTTGLVFFGTPFRGAEGMSQSEMLQAALSEYERDEVHPEVLNILDPGNELLQDLVDGFGKTRSLPNKAHIACFFELQPSNVGAIVGRQRKKRYVVSESSGCLDVSETTEKYSLERSHFNMNKFGKPLEEDFLTVSEVVDKMARAASGLLQSHQGQHRIPFNLKDLPAVSRFVQRKTEMMTMQEYFFPKDQRAIYMPMRQKTFLLYGLGGMGKTQLAVAFAREYHEKFSAVFWLEGSSVDRLNQSFIAIASKLPQEELTADVKESLQAERIDADLVVRGVLRWLSVSSNKHWLLVIDNADREWNTRDNSSLAYNLREHFPEGDHGSILVTSRLAGLARMFEAELHVDRVDDKQARSILEVNTCEKLEDAQIIINKLDRLPLALTQAGAYLRETNISVASYIKHYDNTWKDLMEEQGRYSLQEYENCSILTTWMISYEQVASKSEGAANLLKLWGFLDREDLWYDLLASVKEFEEDSGVPEWLVMLAESEMKFNRVISLLRRFSLIEASGPRSGSYAIHTVLHTWCRHLSSNDEQKIMLLLVMKIVAQALPLRSETAYWKLQRRLLPHGLHILANLGALQEQRYQDSSTEDDMPAWIWHDFGNLFFAQVKLAEADMTWKRALVGYEKALGAEHRSTLLTINKMGLLKSAQGKLPEAEAMHKRALAGYEKALGPEHTDTLSAVNNLGGIYHAQGKLPEAEAMWKRALVGYEKALGPEHTDTLCTVNNLGVLYSAQSKLPEAEAMHKRALAGYEKALGPEHIDTLRTVTNLGLLYSAQGELADAEAMYKRALAGYEKALGAEHTSTLLAANNLGGLYHAQGKLADAEAMWKRALVGCEKALRAEHTDTLRTVTNLGLLYSAQGELADAEAMYTRALSTISALSIASATISTF